MIFFSSSIWFRARKLKSLIDTLGNLTDKQFHNGGEIFIAFPGKYYW